MSPGDRPSIPLEEEPALFLHPTSTGGAVPQRLQPVRGGFGLEEEPALWPSVRGRSAPALDSRPPAARARRTTDPAAGPAAGRALAATGPGTSALGAIGLVGLAAVLRLRMRRGVQSGS